MFELASGGLGILISIIENTLSKRKKATKVILITIAVLVVAEFTALSWLYISVGKHKDYWANRANEKGEITYLALGDSTAQAIGASSPSRGYVGIIAKRLEQKTGKTVRVVNISVTGATMEDYLKTQAPQVKDIKADYVTIEIGANDVRSFEPQKFKDKFAQVLETLPDGTFVSNMPLFNSRPSSTNNGKLASVIVEQELQSYPNLRFVDLGKETTEKQTIFGFAPDLFHPNNISYKHWADAFWKEIDIND